MAGGGAGAGAGKALSSALSGIGGGGSGGLSGQQMALDEYTKGQGQLAGRTAYGGAGMGTSTNAAYAMTGPEVQMGQQMVGQEIQNQQLQAQQQQQALDAIGSAGTGLGTAAGSGAV